MILYSADNPCAYNPSPFAKVDAILPKRDAEVSDKAIKLEAIFNNGSIKEQMSCFFEDKLDKKLTCILSIDCMIDFLRAGKLDSITAELSTQKPFNNSLKVTDGVVCDLIALRNGGQLS